jgi:hypothetical protein
LVATMNSWLFQELLSFFGAKHKVGLRSHLEDVTQMIHCANDRVEDDA